MNLKMPALKKALEEAGFRNVKTFLSSGNVAFETTSGADDKVAKKCEAAIEKSVGKKFATTVRSIAYLRELLDTDPFKKAPKEAKRLVTFLFEEAAAKPKLPLVHGNFGIYAQDEREVFSAYVRIPGNAEFMNVLEKTYGKNVTTRTWDTVSKVAKYGD